MRRLYHELSWEIRKRDGAGVAGHAVQFGKDLGAQSLRHVVPDGVFVRELSEDGSSVKDLAAEYSLVECAWSHQSRILTMARTMPPDPGNQIAYDSGNAFAGDGFEHVG